jgi:peptide/nickel transport system substrate-binding protein
MALAALVAAGLTLLSACGGGVAAGASGSSFEMSSGGAPYLIDNFNPYSPSAEYPAQGMIYEPLFFFNMAVANSVKPWLATAYAWSDGGKTLTLTLRNNVKWTDGKPMTSADVAFTFNLIRKTPALNQYALPIVGAAADGPDKAVLTFSKPGYSYFDYLAGKTYILPEHIWDTISDPSSYQDQHPVGTGAYILTAYSPQTMTLAANPRYYLPGYPKVQAWRYVALNGNTATTLAVETGQLAWGGSYIPDIRQAYLSKNPKFAVTDNPLQLAFLIPNMKSGVTTDLKVREAISDAINRNQVSGDVYDGYAGATNPESLLTPTYSDVLDPALKNATLSYDPSEARKLLAQDGYQPGPGGIMVKDGKELTIDVKVVSTFTDYVQALDVIAQEEKAAGINMVVDLESRAQFTVDQDDGNFQMVIGKYGDTPSPYVYYDGLLDGKKVAPIGQSDTVGDYGRYDNSTIDSLLAAIAASNNLAVQKPDYYKIEEIVKQQMPDIPLFDQQDEEEFNTNLIKGLPSPADPYAPGCALSTTPDIGWCAMRLEPAK